MSTPQRRWYDSARAFKFFFYAALLVIAAFGMALITNLVVQWEHTWTVDKAVSAANYNAKLLDTVCRSQVQHDTETAKTVLSMRAVFVKYHTQLPPGMASQLSSIMQAHAKNIEEFDKACNARTPSL